MNSPAALSVPVESIDLRNPYLAALLAWLIPGAGHLYQGRTAKGLLFLVCILGTFFYGLYLGNGKVVYASWKPNETRWSYFGQLGVGVAAFPALLQAHRVRSGQAPLFDFMAPPLEPSEWRDSQMHEPHNSVATPHDSKDQLSYWNRHLSRYFELGTVYTVIAGLLNLLVICDAFAGPVPVEGIDEEDETKAKIKID